MDQDADVNAPSHNIDPELLKKLRDISGPVYRPGQFILSLRSERDDLPDPITVFVHQQRDAAGKSRLVASIRTHVFTGHHQMGLVPNHPVLPNAEGPRFTIAVSAVVDSRPVDPYARPDTLKTLADKLARDVLAQEEVRILDAYAPDEPEPVVLPGQLTFPELSFS